MQIALKQSEIEQAIRNYITGMGITMEVFSITLVATRGALGTTAEVEFSEGAAGTGSSVTGQKQIMPSSVAGGITPDVDVDVDVEEGHVEEVETVIVEPTKKLFG